VFKTLGRPLSDLHKEHSQAPDRYEYAGYWLDRSDLKERINNRVLQMVEDGYVEETKQLLDQGYQRGIKPMMSLGYRHMCTHLLDGVSLERAVEMIQRDTRRFARKQRNWLTNLSFDKLVDNHDKAARYSF
jgi:tRNA dimethylallyltransferase